MPLGPGAVTLSAFRRPTTSPLPSSSPHPPAPRAALSSLTLPSSSLSGNGAVDGAAALAGAQPPADTWTWAGLGRLLTSLTFEGPGDALLPNKGAFLSNLTTLQSLNVTGTTFASGVRT
jgi:hypothetical protein